MTVEYIRYKIEQARKDDFLAAYESASKQLDDSKYCLGYELTQCEEEPTSFILRIEWTSTEDHLNGFRKSPDFALFLGHVRPFFNDIQEMNHYQLTAIRKDK
ncbi:antibiotic biosynthesis monooxygenase family protein [Poritiphilus flavus]|uniref:Antibiotic biosynthesis monooxygenase n=1 Tax=Poritiphilus flavus TaxID=2697053 RepID=A0A6L9EGS2_9FLAO|nr:antibiotic biosynthesis monooxygenase family protein [Poritiphilus flavus]NAS13846.1 antibiotic biosynthesis monooxygenase [Poritiphilus flavus]